MKAGVVIFPGSNCDRDVAVALEQATGRPTAMLWHRETELPALDLIVLPGGFSYGDYLRVGAMAAHSPILREIKARAEAGVHVLGICNGFQMLCETGLLPGVLMRNASLRFVCRDVSLRVENVETAFTGGYRDRQVVTIPVAHNDGNYFADADTLDRLEQEGRVVFRYCAADGAGNDGAGNGGANPNGSQREIAGIINARGTVLGLMPHPERAAEPALGGTDGRPMFDSLAAAFA